MQFEKATREKCKLRMALTGPSGSGKTHSALLLAKGLGGKVACIDTEHRRASLYSHLLAFDVINLTAPFSPERYIEAIDAAVNKEYDVLIIDSISHEWDGAGGALEIVDNISTNSNSGNSYFAWRSVTPRHQAFFQKMLQSPLHIIATMRSKQEYIITEINGKKAPKKIGLAPIQRGGSDYEFTTVLDLTQGSNAAKESKDNTGIFHGRDPFKITEKDGEDLKRWLDIGVDISEKNESECVDFFTEMKACETMDDLKLCYKKAIYWINAESNRSIFMEEMTSVKDEAKKTIIIETDHE